MEKNNLRNLYVLLNCALSLLFFGFLGVLYLMDIGDKFESVVGLFFIFFGFTVILFLMLTRHPYYLFFGTFFLFIGISFFIIESNVIPYSAKELWPINGIYFSISLIFTSLYKYKKLKINYATTAGLILIVSVYFILFSFRFLLVSFKQTVLVLIPLCWIVILCWYFIQKLMHINGKNDVSGYGDLK